MATITWKNGSGNFEDASHWSSGSVPGESDTASIQQTGVTVTFGDVGYVNDLDIGSGVSLILNNDYYVLVNEDLTNSGSMQIADDFQIGYGSDDIKSNISNSGVISETGDGVIFLSGESAKILGGGKIILGSDGLVGNSELLAKVADTSVENVDNRISGGGLIQHVVLTNDVGGVIVGDVSNAPLTASTGHQIVNKGLLEATTNGQDNPGSLIVNDSVLNTGTIQADTGALVQLDVATSIITNYSGSSRGTIYATEGGSVIVTDIVQGGNVNTDLQGTIVSSGGTFDGSVQAVDLNAVIDVADSESLTLLGTIENAGSISLSNSDLNVASSPVTLSGGGQIVLQGASNIRSTGGGSTLINVDNAIEGSGTVGDGRLILNNQGTVDANGSDPLSISLGAGSANSGTMEATAGGALEFEKGAFTNNGLIETVDNASSAVEIDAGAKFTNGTLGTLEAANGAEIYIDPSHKAASFTNQGLVLVYSGSMVSVGAGASTNIAGGMLTGGSWTATDNTGAGAAIDFADSFTSDAATLTLNSEATGGVGAVIMDGGTLLQNKLTDIAATGKLFVLGGAYTTPNALSLEGVLSVSSATFTSGAIAAAAGSELTGFGTIASNVTSHGMVDTRGHLTLTGNDAFYGALSGSQIELSGNSFSLNQGVVLSSLALTLTNANVSLTTSLIYTGGQNSGLHHASFAETGSTLSFAASGLSFTSSLSATLTGGSVTGPGTLILDGTSSSTGFGVLGGATLDVGGPFTLSGPLTLGGSVGSAATGGTLAVLAAGALDLLDGASVAIGTNGTGTFTSAGLVDKTGTAADIMAPALTNNGTVFVEGGSLVFQQGITNIGIIQGVISHNGSQTTVTADAAGQTHLTGGTGNNHFVIHVAPTLLDGGAGTDTVEAAATMTIAANSLVSVEAIQIDNGVTLGLSSLTNGEKIQLLSIAGGSSAVVGTQGNDTITSGAGLDTMSGGAGNDTYTVTTPADHVSEAVNGGTDTVFASVSYTLQTGQSVDSLATTSAAGTAVINLTGNDLAQKIYGNAAENILDGQGGADTMVGYGGNDTYRVDNSGDQILETVGQGSDTVFASVSYVLASGVSVERLATSSIAGTAAINLTGNDQTQLIFGNTGDNVLTGGGGADTMYGEGGNDTFHVDNASQRVMEAVNGGSDVVMTSVTYALSAGQSIELLETSSSAGTTAINLTGNDQSQTLMGNAGANILNGVAGVGADTMSGLGGNDIFYVNNANDIVIEVAGGGTDTVRAAVSYVLAAGQSVEALMTTAVAGTTAINLTGNEFSHSITGNAGPNVLTGGSGDDRLYGLGGQDQLNGGTGNNVFAFNAVTDSTSLGFDIITGMDLSHDKFDFTVTPTAIRPEIDHGHLGFTTFDSDLVNAIGAAQLGSNQAVIFVPDDSTHSAVNYVGETFLIVDVNGVAGYQAGQDYIVALQNATGTLTLSDFM